MRFLESATPHDEDEQQPASLGPALWLIIDAVALLKDPKALEALARKALEAQASIDAARKATADLQVSKEKTQSDIADQLAAHRQRIDHEVEEHQRKIAADRAEVAADRKAAAEARKAAEADRTESAQLKAQAARRLRAMEGAAA